MYVLYRVSDGLPISQSAQAIVNPDPVSYAVKETSGAGVWDQQILDFVAPPAPRVISLEEFVTVRLTEDERDDIIEAAKTSRKAATFITVLKLLREVNLDSPFIVSALTRMEQAGLIATGRADEVRDV